MSEEQNHIANQGGEASYHIDPNKIEGHRIDPSKIERHLDFSAPPQKPQNRLSRQNKIAVGVIVGFIVVLILGVITAFAVTHFSHHNYTSISYQCPESFEEFDLVSREDGNDTCIYKDPKGRWVFVQKTYGETFEDNGIQTSSKDIFCETRDELTLCAAELNGGMVAVGSRFKQSSTESIAEDFLKAL